MAFRRAQSSLEFMITAAFALVAFALALIIFSLSQADADSLSQQAEMHRVCNYVSSRLSAAFSAGSGTQMELRLPYSRFISYAAHVSGAERQVTIASGQKVASCPLSTSAVSSGNSSEFYLNESSIARNIDGWIYVG